MIDRIKEIKSLKDAKSGKAHINDLKEVMHSRKVLPKGVCGITSGRFGRTDTESARLFLEAGIKMIEYGETDFALAEEAIEIRKLCSEHGAFFSVDEKLDVAMASNADGICLDNYAKIRNAKEQFNRAIGVFVKNLGEAFKAQESGADYLTIGPMFSTDNGADIKVVSFDEFRRIREKISLPIYAVGGIKYENVQMIKRIGADGIILTEDILEKHDAHNAIESIIAVWSK